MLGPRRNVSEALGVAKVDFYGSISNANHTITSTFPLIKNAHSYASRTHSKAKRQLTRWLVQIGQWFPKCTQTECGLRYFAHMVHNVVRHFVCETVIATSSELDIGRV